MLDNLTKVEKSYVIERINAGIECTVIAKQLCISKQRVQLFQKTYLHLKQEWRFKPIKWVRKDSEQYHKIVMKRQELAQDGFWSGM